MKQLNIILMVLLLAVATLPATEPGDAARLARIGWWCEAKFGLFIHRGFCYVATGEYNGSDDFGTTSQPVRENYQPRKHVL